MRRSKKIFASIIALIFGGLIGVYGYFVTTTLVSFELLLMCSQGKENLIPKYACQNYLFNFGGSPSEIQAINRGIGVMWAVTAEDIHDKTQLLQYLIKKGVDINALDERSGVAALHAVVIENDLDAVELLLKNGARLDVKDKNTGKTPLDFALERRGKPDQPDRTLIINRLKNPSKSQKI